MCSLWYNFALHIHYGIHLGRFNRCMRLGGGSLQCEGAKAPQFKKRWDTARMSQFNLNSVVACWWQEYSALGRNMFCITKIQDFALHINFDIKLFLDACRGLHEVWWRSFCIEPSSTVALQHEKVDAAVLKCKNRKTKSISADRNAHAVFVHTASMNHVLYRQKKTNIAEVADY